MNDASGGREASAGLTLQDVADLVGGRLEGDGTLLVVGVAPVDEAAAHEMAFLAVKRYARYVASCEAHSFLVSAEMHQYVPDGVEGRPRGCPRRRIACSKI